MKKRTKNRVWALQAAYSQQLSGRESGRILEDFYAWRKIGPQNREFTSALLTALDSHLAEVDALLDAHLENWSPKRLAVLDRLLIRLAVTEFLFFEDIPAVVTLDEYVNLARLFGTEDSPRFVNGVLDAVHRSIADKCGSKKAAE